MDEKHYDVAIAYRIYPNVSKVPPVFSDDKLKLSELCLKSFKESLGKLKIKMFVILDNCPPEYSELFKKYFDEKDLTFIQLQGIGNGKTFGKQVEILLEQNYSEYIYFAEDDYFYLPGTFMEMLSLIKDYPDVDFVTPYDHLDIYTLELHNYKSKIIVSDTRHWQTVSCSCMTFLTTKNILNKTKKVFMTYTKNNTDAGLWMSLTKIKIFSLLSVIKNLQEESFVAKIFLKAWQFSFFKILFSKKQNLYVPIPTIATHMDNKYHGYNWDEIFKTKISEMHL